MSNAAHGRAAPTAEFRDARRDRPLWVRALNLLLRPLAGRFDFEADDIWADARRRWPDAPAASPEVAEALQQLVASLRADGALHPIGRYAARDDTRRLALTSLRVEAALRRAELPARGAGLPPLFILGWPRTGTTFTLNLLAQDPANRELPYYESFDPIPPEEGPDRRAEQVDEMLVQLERFSPGYQAIHAMTGTSPEECVALFMNVFRTLQLDFQYRVPGYVAWLLEQDPRVAYEAYRRQLAFVQLQAPRGERWLLKDPTHLLGLEAILELFPDAVFVQLHRDPVESLSSICSLYAATRAIFSDDVDPLAIGREIQAGYWPEGLARVLALREKLPPERFYDLRYPDLVAEPLEAAAAIYGHFGFEWTLDALQGFRRFLARDREGRGEHRYGPAQFGLDPEAIRTRFADYCARFDV